MRNLRLEDGVPRKKSLIQMYMILYYDSQIQETVCKCWAEDHVPNLESNVEVNILESKINPQDSFKLKDPKIPISYKKAIAKIMFEGKSELIKSNVHVQQEAWHEGAYGATVCTDDDETRQLLVREYQRYIRPWFAATSCVASYPTQSDMFFSRNIPALKCNIGVILRNMECKCAAKGIVWLACPSPVRGGKPVAYL